MPFLSDISVSAISGNTPDEKIESLGKQLNEWGRVISNQQIASVQSAEDGSVRIVSGVQDIGGTRVVGTVYYDTTNVPRIFIGLSPLTYNPGIWVSKDGISVIEELAS